MSQAPVMPLWTDALIGDTTHLSAREFGAYMLLLIATWRNNGQPFADDDKILARICRMPTYEWKSQVRKTLVPFFNLEGGLWRQKRLEKEWTHCSARRCSARRNGAMGGRPPQAKPLHINGSQNPVGYSQVNPEGTCEKAISSFNLIGSDEPIIKRPKGLSSLPRNDAPAMAEIFLVECCPPLAPVRKLTDARKTQCHARLKELGGELEQWREFCQRVQQSPFLTGINDRAWRADFDFLLKEANFNKILEGKYDLNPPGGLRELLTDEERQAGLAEARRQAGLREPLNG